MKRNNNILLILFLSILFFDVPEGLSDDLSDFDNLISKDLLEEEKSRHYFSGSYKNIASLTKNKFYETDGNTKYEDYLAVDYNRFRLNYDFDHESRYIIHSELDNTAILSNYSESDLFERTFERETYNELFDLTRSFYPTDNLYYSIGLHRFYFKYNVSNLSFTTGRQIVTFGSGKLWNPLDILNPISPFSIEGEDGLKGIDALKTEYYPSDTSEISFIYSPKRLDDILDASVFINENTDGIIRYKKAFTSVELALLAGRAGRKNLAGFDFMSIVKDGMLRGSFLVADQDDYGTYVIANAGYEYTFLFGLNLILEFFYNSNALNHNSDFKEVYFSGIVNGIDEDNYPYFANQFITFNRYYTGLYLDYEITPLLRAFLFIMYDFESSGIYLSPEISYNVTQNMDLSLSLRTASAEKNTDFYEYDKNPNVMLTFDWYF